MKLYLKVLSFLKPFWKFVALSALLTFSYVLFNNISLWISVDLIRELFAPEKLELIEDRVQSVQQAEAGHEEGEMDEEGLLGLKTKIGLYQRINLAVKRIIIQEDRYDTLKIVCLIIFLSFLLKNMSFYLRRVIINYVELNIIVSIREQLHRVLMRLPLSYFERHHTGEITSIVFNDVNAINTVLNNSFGKMLLSPVQVLTNLVILLLISWKLCIITFTIIPVSGYLIVKIGQSIRRKSRRVFKRISYVVRAFQESISSIRIVKAFTAEEKEESKFQEANRRYFVVHFRANKLNFLTSPLNETLGIFIFVTLLWYGGSLVYAGTGLSAEDFIRFLVFLFAMFQPMKALSGLNNIIQTGMAAAERIFGTIDAPQEMYDKPDARVLDEFEDSICFDHVYFRYNEDQDSFVLKNINLEIQKGEMVAFVGQSGVGKSTLVDLIPRFYDVTEGRILVDGIDIRDLNLTSLRDQIGIVTQEAILSNDTVGVNIGYGLEDVSEEKIIEAAKVANAWEFIVQMEKGLDTFIGEKGIKLSGGQKQRLSIARAVLKNTPILILDEATSSLDSESERLVQEAIDNLMKNRTVLVIAHRLSTVIHADKIVVMYRGEIEDIGSHRKLLKTCSIYRNLYEIQFRDQDNRKTS